MNFVILLSTDVFAHFYNYAVHSMNIIFLLLLLLLSVLVVLLLSALC